MVALRSLDHVAAGGARYTASKKPDLTLSRRSRTSEKSATYTKGKCTSSKTADDDCAAILSLGAARKSHSTVLSAATKSRRLTLQFGFTDLGTED